MLWMQTSRAHNDKLPEDEEEKSEKYMGLFILKF